MRRAAMYGRLAVVKFLIEAHPNHQVLALQSAMETAALYGHLEVVGFLKNGFFKKSLANGFFKKSQAKNV